MTCLLVQPADLISQLITLRQDERPGQIHTTVLLECLRPHDAVSQIARGLDALTPASPTMTWRGNLDNQNHVVESSQDLNMGECLQAFVKLLSAACEEIVSQSYKEDGLARGLLSCVVDEVVLPRLVSSLEWLPFEAQKSAMRAFGMALRLASLSGVGAQTNVSEQLLRHHPETCRILIRGLGNVEIFTYCAWMLRSCSKCAELAEGIMSEFGGACHLIDLAGHQCFDIASEAFATLDELLLSDPVVSSAYLSKSFKEFFEAFHALLHDGSDYVTLRQALRLLAKMLLNSNFMEVMVHYVCNDRFLQIHMNLLRDPSMSIRLEAFHVFKIFVANPRKPIPVQKILRKNSVRLITLLESLGAAKEDEMENSSLHQDLQTVRRILVSL